MGFCKKIDSETTIQFLIDIAVAAILFIIIGSVATILGWIISALKNNGLSPNIISVMVLLEYFLFAVDVVLFTFMVLHSTFKLLKDMVSGWLLYVISVMGLSGIGYITYKLADK